MSTSLRLPPSERDFEIYQQITMWGLSTRLVAEDHQISQTRVRQIVKHVLDWIAATLPDKPEADEKRELRLAQHIAADRIQAAYCELMSQWRQTHAPKFMGQIVRLTLSAARLGVVSGTIDGLAADAIEGPLPDHATSPKRERGMDAVHDEEGSGAVGPSPSLLPADRAPIPCAPLAIPFSSPPPGDCSPRAAETRQATHNVAALAAATSPAAATCASHDACSSQANAAPIANHHPLLTSAPQHPITQVRIAANAPAEVTFDAIRRRREREERGP